MNPTQLKTTRDKLKLTQSGLADALGLSKHGRRTIRRWEKGEWPIPKAIELALQALTNNKGG